MKKREKMAQLREEIALQKANETEETMRAKQMLATMSHELRSPVSKVVSMTEILSTTNSIRIRKKTLEGHVVFW